MYVCLCICAHVFVPQTICKSTSDSTFLSLCRLGCVFTKDKGKDVQGTVNDKQKAPLRTPRDLRAAQCNGLLDPSVPDLPVAPPSLLRLSPFSAPLLPPLTGGSPQGAAFCLISPPWRQPQLPWGSRHHAPRTGTLHPPPPSQHLPAITHSFPGTTT